MRRQGEIAQGAKKAGKVLDKHPKTRYKKLEGKRPAAPSGMRGGETTYEKGVRRMEAFERIRQILCDQLDLEENIVTMDSDIVKDLGADSLDVVDLVMTIEDELGLEVPDDQIENFRTVGDVVRYIEENSNDD